MKLKSIITAGLICGLVGTSWAQYVPFGSNLFEGNFKQNTLNTFNPDYLITTGDSIAVKIWGSFNLERSLKVDAQGNIFIPSLGPVFVRGVKNSDLNKIVSQAMSLKYRDTTKVYASLDLAQPVKVLVTGRVPNPGLYEGISSDSILKFIDKAGGVSEQGSFREISLLRNGNIIQNYDLYDFISKGYLPLNQIQDGDVLLVNPKKSQVKVSKFDSQKISVELKDDVALISDLKKLLAISDSSSEAIVQRNSSTTTEKIKVPSSQFDSFKLINEDTVVFSKDKHSTNLSIRIQGAHEGDFNLVLPVGANLKQALESVALNSIASPEDIQLFRKSIALQQKEALMIQAKQLQNSVLGKSSDTSEEAKLRASDASLVEKYIETLKNIETTGQVIIKGANLEEVLLEEGDIIKIPQKTSLVSIHGETLMPKAVVWSSVLTVKDLIQSSGGLLRKESDLKIVVINRAGESRQVSFDYNPKAGDEVFVIPEVNTYSIETARGITQILYQTAVAARVLVGVF